MKLASYFFTDSYQSFRDAVINLAVNNPELCGDILQKVSEYHDFCRWDDLFEWRVLSSQSMEHHTHVMPRTDELDFAIGGERLPQWTSSQRPRTEDGIQRFLDWCAARRHGRLRADVLERSELRIDDVLRDLYGREAGKLIVFLLDNVSQEVRDEVAASYLDPEYMAQQSTVDVVVRKNSLRLLRGNKGHYLIYTRKGADGELALLKFTHQESAVVYLLYLIDRRARAGISTLAPLSLHRNEQAFTSIYNIVYGLGEEKARARFFKLLYREDEQGKMRVGRQGEIINDIRRCMRKTFEAYDESYVPYVMTARTHLSVSASHIFFEGDAERLLGVCVKV